MNYIQIIFVYLFESLSRVSNKNEPQLTMLSNHIVYFSLYTNMLKRGSHRLTPHEAS